MGWADGSAPLRGDVEWEQLSHAMCVCAEAPNTAGLRGPSARPDSQSNKAVPSFTGCLPRASDTVVAPPTQGRSVTCLSPAVSN